MIKVLLITVFVVGVFIAFFSVIIVIIFKYVRKSKSDSVTIQEQPTTETVHQESPSTNSSFISCPVCNTKYTDLTLQYCLIDGTLLTLPHHDKNYDSEATVVLPNT